MTGSASALGEYRLETVSGRGVVTAGFLGPLRFTGR